MEAAHRGWREAWDSARKTRESRDEEIQRENESERERENRVKGRRADHAFLRVGRRKNFRMKIDGRRDDENMWARREILTPASAP